MFCDHFGGGSHGGGLLRVVNVARTYGWMGVDLFFVLSGFLITGILYDTLGDSHYFRRFFARRSLRIFPIYYAVFAFLLLLTPFTGYQWHAAHALFLVYLGNFAGNVNFSFYQLLSARHPGTHATIAHFWSLCVEEQFYLLWPLIVFTVRKRERLIRIAAGVSVLALLLRCLMVWGTTRYTAELWIVRTLPFRMDTLLIGGILALVLRGPHADWWQRASRYALLVGGGLTVLLFVLSPAYDSPWLLTVGYSVIAVACAGLVGMVLPVDGVAYRVFHLRPLRFLGRYSYGFYIFHLIFQEQWIRFLRFLALHLHSLALAGLVETATVFVVTLLAAKLSYDLFESRFLRYKVHFEYDVEQRTHTHAFSADPLVDGPTA